MIKKIYENILVDFFTLCFLFILKLNLIFNFNTYDQTFKTSFC